MTTQRHILRDSEQSALLRDGLSNADLTLLLSTVNRSGEVLVSRERIGELIANYKSLGHFNFNIRVEEGFDPTQALADLRAALQERDKGISGNPEQVAAHVKHLHALARNPKDFHGIRSIQSVIESAQSKAAPELPAEIVREASCQYLSMLVPTTLPKSCPATPAYLGGAREYGGPRGL